MRFLNGWKTWIGVIASIVVALNDVIHVLPASWRPYVAGAAAMLTTLGLAHKVEKRRDARRRTEGSE